MEIISWVLFFTLHWSRNISHANENSLYTLFWWMQNTLCHGCTIASIFLLLASNNVSNFVINITVISSILDPTLHFAGIYFTVYYFTRASVLHTCHVLPLQRRELYVIFFLPGLFFRSPPLFPSYSLNFRSGTSLVVQWLRLWAPSPGGPGLILGQGARSHMLQLRPRAAKFKKKKKKFQVKVHLRRASPTVFDCFSVTHSNCTVFFSIALILLQ